MSHYFDERPDVDSNPVTIDVVTPSAAFSYSSDRGVFSQDRLDTGTRLLLVEAPAPPTVGDLLDLGCGAGPIALSMAIRSPEATVWAVDVNERALALCAQNARDNGLDNVRAVQPDDVPPGVTFAAIWSNPPIRIGKAALHELLARWLGRLTPDGTATLVVQKHLGADSLQRWLIDQGWETTRAASRAGYRLLQVGAGDDDTR